MGQTASRAVNEDTFFKIEAAEMPAVQEKYVDLACAAQGGKVLKTTDELFGEGFHLIQKGDAIEDKNRETANGFWKDGWETSRHNKADYHSAIIKLAASGRIFAIDIDTSFFDGSHPAYASVEGYFAEKEETDTAKFEWTEILPKVKLSGNSHHYYGIGASAEDSVYTHLRLNMFPDGGIARFRAYGTVEPTHLDTEDDELVDLACLSAGGRVIRSNDSRYGSPDNILLPVPGVNTRDGWQTKRSREVGHHDWVEIKLGNYGLLKQVEVDTTHFRGNNPDFVSLDACCSIYNDIKYDADLEWTTLLPKSAVLADKKNVFDLKQTGQKYSHVRLNIYPDGGISRLRVYGQCRPGTPELKPLGVETASASAAANIDVPEIKGLSVSNEEANETVKALEVSDKAEGEEEDVQEEEEEEEVTTTIETTTTTTTLVVEESNNTNNTSNSKEEDGFTVLTTEVSSVSTLVGDAEEQQKEVVEEKPKKGKGSRGGRTSAKTAANVAVAAAKLAGAAKTGKKARGRSASAALDDDAESETAAAAPRAKKARE